MQTNFTMACESNKINFGPGPAKLPVKVLERAQKELLCFGKTGISIMEMSHRSADFSKVLDECERNFRDLLSIPDNYRVLFLQGGGCGQFAAMAMNLIGLKEPKMADYIITGNWSMQAAKEAQKYGKVNLVTPKCEQYTSVPDPSTWKLTPEASYVYYCANETVHGIEFDFVPETNGVPLVCDFSSSILSHSLDITKFGAIHACAQKNIGCPGASVVVVRHDLLGHALKETPSIWDYNLQASHNSLFNTPPMWSIYIMGLIFQWISEEGGIGAMEAARNKKAKILYDAIDNSGGFYVNNIKSTSRSHLNVPFNVGGKDGDDDLEKKFVDGAQKRGIIQIKGHRSVGGMRASIYNAITVEEVYELVDYMKEFRNKNEFK